MCQVGAIQPYNGPSNRVRDDKSSRCQTDWHFSDGGANVRPVSVGTVRGTVALLVCEFYRGSWFQWDWVAVAVAICDYPNDYLIAVSYVLDWVVVVVQMA